MTPDQVFSIANTLALAGWVVLILGGKVRKVASLVTGMILPLLFAVLYAFLIARHWGEGQGGFGTLTGVHALFSNDWVLLAGWVHYLAFDLFVGSWEVRDARKAGLPHLVVVPCLILTFLFGPIGFLLYSLIRCWRARTLDAVIEN